MKKVYNNQRTLLFLLLFATLFMGIGFASINSIICRRYERAN